MKNELTRDEIKSKLAGWYTSGYDRYSVLMDEARAAKNDGDDDAFRALTRRADKISDMLDGICIASEALGIERDELKAAAGAD